MKPNDPLRVKCELLRQRELLDLALAGTIQEDQEREDRDLIEFTCRRTYAEAVEALARSVGLQQ